MYLESALSLQQRGLDLLGRQIRLEVRHLDYSLEPDCIPARLTRMSPAVLPKVQILKGYVRLAGLVHNQWQ